MFWNILGIIGLIVFIFLALLAFFWFGMYFGSKVQVKLPDLRLRKPKNEGSDKGGVYVPNLENEYKAELKSKGLYDEGAEEVLKKFKEERE